MSSHWIGGNGKPWLILPCLSLEIVSGSHLINRPGWIGPAHTWGASYQSIRWCVDGTLFDNTKKLLMCNHDVIPWIGFHALSYYVSFLYIRSQKPSFCSASLIYISSGRSTLTSEADLLLQNSLSADACWTFGGKGHGWQCNYWSQSDQVKWRRSGIAKHNLLEPTRSDSGS